MSFHYIKPPATRGVAKQIEHHLATLSEGRVTKNSDQLAIMRHANEALRWFVLWQSLNRVKIH